MGRAPRPARPPTAGISGPRRAAWPVRARYTQSCAGGSAAGGSPRRRSGWRRGGPATAAVVLAGTAAAPRPTGASPPREQHAVPPPPALGGDPDPSLEPLCPSPVARFCPPPPPPNCDAHKIGWVRPTDRAAAERGTSRFPKSRLSLGGGGGVAGMEHEGCAPAEGPGQVGLEEGAGSGRAPSYTVRGVLNRPRSRWPSARSARVLWRSRWEKEHERMGVAPFACKVHAVLVASRHFWPYPTRGHRRQGLGVKAFPAPPPHLPAHPIECPRHPPWGSPTAPPPPCAGCAMSAVAIDEHAVGAGCTIAVFVCLRKY